MNRMIKLLIDNRKKGSFRAEHSDDGDEVTLFVYDVIVSDEFEAEYWGGVAPESFIKELNSIDAKVIHLRINSPGGSVFAARSMEQALREHSAKIIAHIDGYAASAASFLAMGADEVVMNQGGFFMIHKAMTFAYGNTDDLISTASLLEQIDNSLVTTYHNRTGQDADKIEQWMKDETWFGADDSVEFGFADRIEDGVKAENKSWDLSAYEHAPENTEESTAEPGNSKTHINVKVGLVNQDDIIKSVVDAVTEAVNPKETDNTIDEPEPENIINTDQLKRQLDSQLVA